MSIAATTSPVWRRLEVEETPISEHTWTGGCNSGPTFRQYPCFETCVKPCGRSSKLRPAFGLQACRYPLRFYMLLFFDAPY